MGNLVSRKDIESSEVTCIWVYGGQLNEAWWRRSIVVLCKVGGSSSICVAEYVRKY